MSEKYEVLLAEREKVLKEIREIEESCEGISNPTVARQIEALNLQQSALVAKRQECQAMLESIAVKLQEISAEVAKLSGTGNEKILEAISKQRYYFFKNKPNIIFDKDSGLLWPNLNYYTQSYEGKLEELEIDGFTPWRLPKSAEVEQLLRGKFPFRTGKGHYIYTRTKKRIEVIRVVGKKKGIFLDGDFPCNAWWDDDWCDYGKSDFFILPACDVLRLATNYSTIQDEKNHAYSEQEKLGLILSLFQQFDLLPGFDNNEITVLYEKLYYRKPILLAQLEELQSKLGVAQQQVLLSSTFDYKAWLAEYDLESIATSVLAYYKAVKSWIALLLKQVDAYEKANRASVQELREVSLALEQEYSYDETLEPQENALCEARQRYARQEMFWGAKGLRDQLLSIEQQAQEMEREYEEINDSEETLAALHEVESRKRPSFALLAENTAELVRKYLVKIEYYQQHQQFVRELAGFIPKWQEEYSAFRQQTLPDLTALCTKAGLSAEEVEEISASYEQEYYALQKLLLPLLKCGRKYPELVLSREQGQTPLGEFLIALERYALALREVYRTQLVAEEGTSKEQGLTLRLECLGRIHTEISKLRLELWPLLAVLPLGESRLEVESIVAGLAKQMRESVLLLIANYNLTAQAKQESIALLQLEGRSCEGAMLDEATYCKEIEAQECAFGEIVVSLGQKLG